MPTTTIHAHLDLDQGRFTLEKSTTAMTKTVAQVGFWAAVVTTALNVLFTLGLISIPATRWAGAQLFAAEFKPIESLPAIPALLLGPAVMMLMLSIHFYAPQPKRIFSLAAVLFTAIYAALCSLNYFVQLTAVRQGVLNGDASAIAPFVMANPQSVFLAVDTLGYLFLFIACLLAAPVFDRGRLEQGIRWLLVGSAVLGLIGVLGYAIDQPTIYFAGLMVSGVTFLVLTTLLAVLYNRLLQPD
jgi:hypothetical protein